MYFNNCCPPKQKKDPCSCKEGILCAIDFFYQYPEEVIDLYYYPRLLLPEQAQSQDQIYIPNRILKISYVTQDILPICIPPINNPTSTTPEDITYLNICKIDGFSFKLSSLSRMQKENEIKARFSTYKCATPNSVCCKNGVMEYLYKTKEFLMNAAENSTDEKAIISTISESFYATEICCINQDTVWFKYEVDTSNITYYVLSICEIIGITKDKNLPQNPGSDTGDGSNGS